jgi:hypothetical protein
MKRLFAESYLLLLKVELLMAFGKLNSLHRVLEAARVKASRPGLQRTADELCRSIDLACVLYPKQVLCLQRSVATALLLRRYGFSAEMVIGAQMLPFKSHAWVELGGTIVNDRPYIREIYKVLERCQPQESSR